MRRRSAIFPPAHRKLFFRMSVPSLIERTPKVVPSLGTAFGSEQESESLCKVKLLVHDHSLRDKF